MDPEPSVCAWHQCWCPGQMNLIFYVSNLQLLGLSGVFALLVTLYLLFRLDYFWKASNFAPGLERILEDLSSCCSMSWCSFVFGIFAAVCDICFILSSSLSFSAVIIFVCVDHLPAFRWQYWKSCWCQAVSQCLWIPKMVSFMFWK